MQSSDTLQNAGRNGPIKKRWSRSISRVLSRTVIHLGHLSPSASSNLPGDRAGHTFGTNPLPPYLVLLRVGFALPLSLPIARCALTAPFHPYLLFPMENRRYIFCGTFRRLAPPRHYLAPCPMEPGLSSLRASADSDCPTNSKLSLTVAWELCQSSLS